MGAFYVNYTLRGPSQKVVAKELAGRRALVSPSHNDCVVVFDEASDQQVVEQIAALALRLSGKLDCPVLAVLNHDDDILWYRLYVRGKLADEYSSAPGYFDPAASPSIPAGGDASQLCSAFGTGDVSTIERVLRKPTFNDDCYAFASDRHADLVRALNLPPFAVNAAYAGFDNGTYPEGLSPNDMLSAVDAPEHSAVETDRQRRRDWEFDPQQLGAEDPSRPCKHLGCG